MPEQIMIKKQYLSKAEVDDEERTVTAVISTDIVDRDKEVLLPKGVDFEKYEKNPVVLWAHEYSATPIARSLWLKKGYKGITAKIKFALTDKAEEVYQLFKGGFLKAFSVGFLPTKSHEPKPDEIKKRPEWAEARRIIDEWELLEFSAVPVPANPDALAVAVKSKKVELSENTIKELGVEDNAEVTVYMENTDSSSNNTEIDIKVEPNQKPEETENYIRIPVRSCDITATITISAKEGIKALYCGKVKKVATYLFDKAKGWTMTKAKAWVKEHESSKSLEDKPVIVVPHRVIRPHRILRRPVNPKDVTSTAINMLKGRIYM